MKINPLLPILFALATSPVLADPLSAIDWLSRSLETPQDVAPDTPLTGVTIDQIETTNLSDVQKDTVGLFPSQISGIPTDFWGDSSATKLAAFIRNAPSSQLPEITELWRRIVLAELDPPIGMSQENTLLLARLDNLLTLGDLDPAEALLKAADPNNPQLFRRWFDVSILTQRADDACKRMVSTPGFAPTLQARVFCLARAGDWSAASVTLTTGKALGTISSGEAHLLGMFLDPEIFDGEPNPPMPKILTPLSFVMREALALPRPTQSLPLAFLHMDLQNRAGWKVRIEAAERLARERAIPPANLLDLYLEGSPSASGGVWERVDAVQRLINALKGDDIDKQSRALIRAYQTMASVGLEATLAELFASSLAKTPFNAQAKDVAFKLAVLSPQARDITQTLTPKGQVNRFVVSILTESFDVSAQGNLQLAISNALTGRSPKTVLHQVVDEGRLGEAVLAALTLMRSGTATDVGDIEVALSVLAYEGFRKEAIRIATQLLLLGKTV